MMPIAAMRMRQVWSPLFLFVGSEDGCVYDQGVSASLFQESTGITPVTAAGQAEGLVLDNRYGLARGTELITNGTFDSSTAGWTPATATLSVVGGRLSVVPSDNFSRFAYQAISTVVGRTYELKLDYDQSSSTGARYFAGTTLGSSNTVANTTVTGAGSIRRMFVALGTTTYIGLGTNNSNSGLQVLFDNISVKEVPGNHAVQATSTARPAYRVSPPRVDYDAVDDKLTTNFSSALGANCTVGRSIPGVGASILTGQTIGTSFDDSIDNCALVIVNRDLTTDETANLTAWLDTRAFAP